jgi:hypothetical protein
MSRTDVAQTLLSVLGLATTQYCKPSGPGSFGRGRDKGVCAATPPYFCVLVSGQGFAGGFGGGCSLFSVM